MSTGDKKMTSPICDFVQSYALRDVSRLHMPGHKGFGPLGVEQLDITEIDGADVLYSAKGIIRESEQNAASLFGTAHTLYSAEGSSLSIRAMLYLAMADAKAKGKHPYILAGRNAHKTFMNGIAMLDIDTEWIYPDGTRGVLACTVTPETLERALSNARRSPTAVYITSPDYLGNTCDIRALSEVCRRHGVLLLVDNAHGAYLKFLPQDMHPISNGADICCDSAHKTLPVLTGGAYLHISRAASHLCEQAEHAMSLFASTSPSYLVLQSLDAANAYICDGYKERLHTLTGRIDELKHALTEHGYTTVGDEPIKLTVAPKGYGYTGEELMSLLSERGIICEFADRDFTVMMFTPETDSSHIDLLEKTLLTLPRKHAIDEPCPELPICERVISPREALLAPSKEVDVSEALGCVLASAGVSCPPAIPIVICGERIDERAIRALKYYGADKVRIVL